MEDAEASAVAAAEAAARAAAACAKDATSEAATLAAAEHPFVTMVAFDASNESRAAVAFSDGSVAAVAMSDTGGDDCVLPLEVPTWLATKGALKGRAQLVRASCGFVVSNFDSGAIHVWDGTDGSHAHWVRHESLAASRVHFLEVCIGPSGRRALTGSALREISLWDLERSMLCWTQMGTGRITAMRLYPACAVAAAGGKRSAVMSVWAPKSGALLWSSANVGAERLASRRYQAHKGHVDAVRCFCVAPAPMRLLISGGDGGRVCLWYLPALETKPIADVVAMRESRDASPDVAAALDAASSSVVRVLKGHEGPVVALECDFSKVVSAGCVSRVIVVPSVVSQRLQADTPPCFPSPPCSLRAWSDSMEAFASGT